MHRPETKEEVLTKYPLLASVPVKEEAPGFKHDCEQCVFLGVSTGEVEYDVYFYENDFGGTVIFRFGIDGDYYSGGSDFTVGNYRVPALN